MPGKAEIYEFLGTNLEPRIPPLATSESGSEKLEV